MDNTKSYNFKFLILINKCILLFNYIDIVYQKEILNDIKNFILKLKENYQKKDITMLEALIYYFKILINDKIYKLLNIQDRENIIKEVDKKILKLVEELLNDPLDKENIENNSTNSLLNERSNNSTNDSLNDSLKESFKDSFSQRCKDSSKDSFSQQSNDSHNNLNNKLTEEYINKTSSDIAMLNSYVSSAIKDFEQKVSKLNEYIDNSISSSSNSLKENDNKVNILNDYLKENDNKVNILSDYLKETNETFNKYISDIYKYTDSNIENKAVKLGQIFNENIQTIYDNLSQMMTSTQNKFLITFDKESNDIKLHFDNKVVSTTKLNIKGLIGPRGPDGKPGLKGDTPIFRKVALVNNKLKFIIQDTQSIYEIVSEDTFPVGPPGPRGERGEPGKQLTDLKWNQDSVMRVDNDHPNSLIFLKSLCVGDKSHCLKDNSLAIGGAVCYTNNSLAIGQNSKTLDSESIALYGTCIGKNAFAYRADNVDENTFQIGKKEKNNYNLNSVNINSKEINFECETFNIKSSKLEFSRIKELEEKINSLEKKITDILKKI